MAKDTRIAFRTSGAFKERVKKASIKVKLDESTLAERALEAVVEYIEEHGGIWLPLKVVPEEQQHFSAAGEAVHADAGGLSSISTPRVIPEASDPPSGLNEDPPPKPRIARTRAALRKMQDRELKRS